MRAVECYLLSTSITQNSLGVEIQQTTQVECPIIKVENIYAKEFYKANEAGHRPTLRLRISALNYNNEEELTYNGITYTIIRIDDEVDELVLICERKVRNVD